MLASFATALMPGAVMAGIRADKPLSWTDYQDEMKQLASAYANRTITQRAMAARGVQLLQQLDTADNAFQAAVYASSYRRPHVNLNCADHRAGFDLGLTSSYSRAG